MGMDYERVQAAILKERVAEGEAKGREEGRAEGMAEGMAISVSRLLDSGMSVGKVAELLKISEDECHRYADLATRIQ